MSNGSTFLIILINILLINIVVNTLLIKGISDNKSSNTSIYIDASLKNLNFPPVKVEGDVFHLFSHGKPGELFIEGEWKNAKQIAEWLKNTHKLRDKSQLNIYGCEFAKGEKGRIALSYLRKKLTISVAGSNDTTGIDGDWELEVGTPKNTIEIHDYMANL